MTSKVFPMKKLTNQVGQKRKIKVGKDVRLQQDFVFHSNFCRNYMRTYSINLIHTIVLIISDCRFFQSLV